MSDILYRYHRAQDGFDAVAAALPAAGWDDPSACAGWSARDVLGHVVWGQRLLRALATGDAFTDRVGAPGSQAPGRSIGADPVGAWRSARQEADPALTPAALLRRVDLPAFGGDVPLSTFLHALVVDLLAHGWDIGYPAGMDVRLDAELVPEALAWSRAHELRAPGGIGPEVPVPDDADEQTRFLGFLGRSPGRVVAA